MTSHPFQYKPLALPKEIRLLVLEPAATRSSPLQGSLQHTTISACDHDLIDNYTALSYVWGDPRPSDNIILLGSQTDTTTTANSAAAVSHPIGANLAAALRDLRDADRPHRIWADALCINQSDIPERNAQVALMGDIYRVAAHTVIYLGPLTAAAATVLDATAANRSLLVSESDDAAAAAAAATASDVLSRPWFRRVWIFQELVLSADPWVQCGPRRVRWRALCATLRGCDGSKTLTDMNIAREALSAGDLFFILENRRGFGATDPRDVVFAHVGLATDRDAVLAAVGVDYAAPVEDVYAATARYYLATHRGKLDMLLGRAGLESARLAGLTSWAPDWSVALPHPAEFMYADQLRHRVRPQGVQYTFAAEGRVLAALGYHVDLVEHVSLVLPDLLSAASESSIAAYHQRAEDLLALYRRQGGVFWSADQFGRHARISVRGVEKQHRDLCLSLCREWRNFFRSLLDSAAPSIGTREAATHEMFLDFFAKWSAAESEKDRIFTGSDSEGIPRLLYDYLDTRMEKKVPEGRRLASTAGGRCGVVPSKARQGDLIVNLANSDIAYVLRATEARELLDVGDQNKEILDKMASLDGTPLVEKEIDNQTIIHCQLVGECFLDGQVGWAYGDATPDYKVYALR